MFAYVFWLCSACYFFTGKHMKRNEEGMRKEWRQCGRVVRALALKFVEPGFKTRFDHSLNLILEVPGSTSQPHF